MFRILLTGLFAAACFGGLMGCEVRFRVGELDDLVGAKAVSKKKLPSYIDPKTKKDKAELQLKRLDGKVKRDKSLPGSPVVDICLYSNDVTDDDLKQLASFKSLAKLEIRSDKVTGSGFAALTKLPLQELNIMWARGIDDKGMKDVAKLTTLKVLHLPAGKITDDGLKEIATLTNLEELTVGSGINDRGFYALKTLKKLRVVKATNCGVSDGAMRVLSQLPEMRKLVLYGSRVTDIGYKYIGRMSKLKEIQTSYRITNKGVAELGKLKNLRKLSVWNSRVSIGAIRALPNLKKLKDLDIGTWSITAEQADKLRTELTDCNIVYDK